MLNVYDEETVKTNPKWWDIICPGTINWDGFAYMRKNINKKSVSLICSHHRKLKCDTKLLFKHLPSAPGAIAETTATQDKKHTQSCCIMNRNDPNDYDWDSKMANAFNGLLRDETANFKDDCCINAPQQDIKKPVAQGPKDDNPSPQKVCIVESSTKEEPEAVFLDV